MALQTEPYRPQVRLRITDNGSGFPEQILEQPTRPPKRDSDLGAEQYTQNCLAICALTTDTGRLMLMPINGAPQNLA